MADPATDPFWDDPHVAALIDLALAEDLGAGDRTSEALVPAFARARGRLRAKQGLVVCGLPLLERVFRRLGDVHVSVEAAEGTEAAPGQVLATLEGHARTLLAGERVALNLLQHLCGIATLTRAYVKRAQGTSLVVRDTRKTLPGMRALAKYGVRTGGGMNHRLGLDDAILIKDNHLALASAVRLVAGRVPLEVSGGVTREHLPALAALGVQLVAVGALTHSAPAADLNLKLEPLP